MPLKKLWNSIVGNTSASEQQPARATGEQKPSQSRKRATTNPSRAAKPSKPTRSLMDMMGRGSHASICRLVKRSGATSVLEIGVGNGERAIAVAQSLLEINPDETVRYAAIDGFEMAGGCISLKDFNRTLREQNVHPTLVPMDICSGLARVSSTLGIMDLVLIAEPSEQIDLPAVKLMLRRLTSDKSVVYMLQDEQWEKVDLHNAARNRSRAA